MTADGSGGIVGELLPRPLWHRFGLVSVASDPEEARALLQRRIGVFVGTMLLAWTVNGVVAVVSAGLFLPEAFMTPGAPRLGLFHVLGNLALLGVLLACRDGARSHSALNWIDAAVTVGQAALLAAMMSAADLRYRSDLNVTLAVALSLIARAAIVPSTGARTLALGAIATVPTVAATLVMLTRLAAPPVPVPLACLQIVVWLSLAVGLSTTISQVMYGLSAKLRETTRLGQYTLERKIGQGGMGSVYLARHALLRRPTAIKLLHSAVAAQQDRERFEREVQTTSALRHPNTVAIYDYGHTPEGVFYYAMEYLHGIDLERLIVHDGRLHEGRVVHILKQVAGALEEAHQAGLIHRDIKPSNIVLCDFGDRPDFAKVLDFGLVKEMGVPDTSEGAGAPLVGTPLYMSPESITDPATIDARSDLYALGALGYALLTGRPPFTGRSVVEVFFHHLSTPVEPPSQRRGEAITPALEAVILACLAKDREQRPISAAELAAQLTAASAPAWTLAEARTWWSNEGVVLLGQQAPPSTSAITRTMAIDLAAR